MTLNQLWYFYNVTKYSSITNAANKLYVTHSAISRAISELETELKVALFIRENHKLILTDAGLLLVEHCKIILADIEKLQVEMKELANDREKTFRISLPLLDAKSDIVTAINKFQAEYPEVSLAFEDLDLNEIEKEIINGKLDLVITYSFIVEKLNLSVYNYTAQNLFQEDIVAVLNNNSPEAKLEYLDLHSTKMKQPLILANADDHFLSEVIPSSFFEGHRNPHHAKPISLNSIIISVINDVGWTCLPRCLADRFSAMCTILPIRDLDTSHYVTMCWRKESKNHMISKLTQLIIDEVNSN